MRTNLHYKILIIEDDPGICTFLKASLVANDYDVIIVTSGQEALSMMASHCPDCVLLDLGLPDMDGTEVIAGIRKWTSTPIIVISARNHEEDKVNALDLGADDYLTKPFSTNELQARIRTALRHVRTGADLSEPALSGSFHVGDLVIDYNRHLVMMKGTDVHLTPNEFKIVSLLGRHAGQVLTYNAILRELWGPSVMDDNKILRVHMASIRRKIEPDPTEPRYFFTEVGVGYRLAES